MARRSLVYAGAAALAALALYVVTLAPGLIGLEDTPKFQFIGRILGTAHNPSYPLYVLVSYVFGWLPIGSLAWRINFMSALFGAATVAVFQLTIVELGYPRIIGLVAALGVATGVSFWATSTFAEVYTLHACLVAALMFSLVHWRRTMRPRWFFVAVGCFALGLGHHTSIVVVVPAVAFFAILTAPRFALAPKTIAIAWLLVALGFSQYLFVVLRTHQGAYLESSATNLSELWGVIRGKAWADTLRPFSIDTVLSLGPATVQPIGNEVSMVTLIAAGVGLLVLAWRDRALLALTIGIALGFIGFALFFPGQTEYFLLPAYMCVWLMAAAGVGSIASMASRWRTAAVVAATLPLVAVVVSHAWQNFPKNDLSHQRFHMRFFDALVEQLPPKAALVGEDWLVDRMVLYEKFSDPRFDARGLEAQVDPARWRTPADRERELYAFGGGASRLREQGFDFEYRMWPMSYGPLRRFLDDQPGGSVVALAIPAMRLATVIARDAVPLDRIGDVVPQPSSTNLVAIGAIGRQHPVRADSPAEQSASVLTNRGMTVGASGVISPNHILAEASFDRASITVNFREVIVSSWPVVALWNPQGAFQGAWAVSPDGTMPMPDSPVSLHRFRGARQPTMIGNTPTELTEVAQSGHMVIAPVQTTPLVVYAVRRWPLHPTLFDPPFDAPSLIVREFVPGDPGLTELQRKEPGMLAGDLRSAYVYRIEIVPWGSPRTLTFGGVPDGVWGQRSGSGEPAVVYGIDLMGQLSPVDDRTDRLHVARDYHQLFLASGWSAIEADDTETGGYTRTIGPDGELLIPCAAGACTRIVLQMRPVDQDGMLTVTVNGTTLSTQSVGGVWGRYQLQVPASALRVGMNSFRLHTTRPLFLSDVIVSRVADVP